MKDKNLNKNWVSGKLLIMIFSAGILAEVLAVLFNSVYILSIVLSILGGLIFIIFLYMLYAHYKLSASGGNLQTCISEMLIDRIPEQSKGRLIDIGCGSGVLSVEIALKHPALQLDAVDYWGGTWGYSKVACEQLAKDNQVNERITFTKASASTLPFGDETFDIVISNMVFHEVADTKDKRDVIKEALRILKKGGIFIFQDQFKDKRIYGKTDELLAYIQTIGVKDLLFEETGKADFIPPLLNNTMFFGSSALIQGVKMSESVSKVVK
ncbi:MAG: class I SAM-dependent methyltransferase [Tannerella sp.]|jgi:ubiquinone/menaquinone biosynthesis C-methylase UbiE|nr:class I SAM-dependent methyltransferase [Tannerella sp.]